MRIDWEGALVCSTVSWNAKCVYLSVCNVRRVSIDFAFLRGDRICFVSVYIFVQSIHLSVHNSFCVIYV